MHVDLDGRRGLLREVARMSRQGPYRRAARGYRQRGWPNPIPVRGKHPPVAGYTGKQGADAADADVTRWNQGPEGGWNVALRLQDGVIGIDVDAYDGKRGDETVAKAEAELGPLPPTWSTTSRGPDQPSRILLYRVPTGLNWGSAEPHFERYGGQVNVIHRGWRYAMVAPSIHPGTKRDYRWYLPGTVQPNKGIASAQAPAPGELAELPAAWVAMLTAPGREPHDDRRERAGQGPAGVELDDAEPIPAGKRRRHMLAYAGKLRQRRLSRNEARLLYQAMWDRLEQPPGDPAPWERYLAWFEDTYDRYAPGPWLEEPPPVEEPSEAKTAPATDAKPSLLAGLRNGKWLDEQQFAPLAYALPGILPEGSALLVGPPKIGKSWLVLTLALATASGGKALGIDVPCRPTFYLALEDGDRRLQDRCRKLLLGQPIPPELDYLIRLEQGRVVDTIAAWLKLHTGEAPLVILDTLGKVMPPAQPGESAYGRDYRVGTTLKRLADEHPGMTLLVNHHDRKAASDDFIDSVSGTHGLAGSADTILVLARDRNETAGLLKVTGRDIPEGEYALQLQDGHSWRLDGTDLPAAAKQAQKVRAASRATANLGDRAVDVILYVHQHPEGVRAAEVAQALELEPKQAQVYLARALKAGRLERPQRGLYLPVGSVGSVGSAGQSATRNQQPNTGVGLQTGTLTSQANTPNTSNTPTGEVYAKPIGEWAADGRPGIAIAPTHRCAKCGKEWAPPPLVATFPHTGCGGAWQPLARHDQRGDLDAS